ARRPRAGRSAACWTKQTFATPFARRCAARGAHAAPRAARPELARRVRQRLDLDGADLHPAHTDVAPEVVAVEPDLAPSCRSEPDGIHRDRPGVTRLASRDPLPAAEA